MARKQNFSDRFWNDKHGNFVVWQRPNIFLWTWIVSVVVSVLMDTNAVERFVTLVGEIAIFIWAVLELTRGVNGFRKLLGFCVLLLFAVSFLL